MGLCLYFLQQIFSGFSRTQNKQGLLGNIFVSSTPMCRLQHDSCWLFGDLYSRAMHRPAKWQDGSGSQQMNYRSCWVFAAKGALTSIETQELIFLFLLHLILKSSLWTTTPSTMGFPYWPGFFIPALLQNMVNYKLIWITLFIHMSHMETHSFLHAPSGPSESKPLCLQDSIFRTQAMSSTSLSESIWWT